MSPLHLIFDLDGTLVDSAPAILGSLDYAFSELKITPMRSLGVDIVGPPLPTLLGCLLKEDELELLPLLVSSFTRHYDEVGCLLTRPYGGIEEMLSCLLRMPVRMCIATNKRLLPSRKIVKHLGWERLFDGLYAFDHFSPAMLSKSDILRWLNSNMPGTAEHKTYIGDLSDDAEAARVNKMPFIWASWGYGRINAESLPSMVAREPLDILSYVEEFLSR